MPTRGYSGHQQPHWLVTFISLLPALIAVLLTVVLILSARLDFSEAGRLSAIGMIVLFILAGLALGYGVRFLLPTGAAPPIEDGNADRNRAKIARWVVVAGTIGIFVTAVVVIVAMAINEATDWEDRALGVFTAILPVFSTWVGTVLAFYFSNESFRQGTEAGQSQAGGTGGGDPITKPGIMVPYATMPKVELTTAQIGDKDPRAAAAALALRDLVAAFPEGAGRLVIFDDKKVPLYVLRRAAMPTNVGETDTLQTYLSVGANEDAARNFTWTAASASVADARRLVELRRITDLFVTEQGGGSEPVSGWVPDENLRRT